MSQIGRLYIVMNIVTLSRYHTADLYHLIDIGCNRPQLS